jgi:DNA invertase Pin-like site-specific DNA recombinase
MSPSGAKSDRSGLNEAKKYLRKGDTLVVWKLDRLGRSLRDLINIVNELEQKNVSFVSLQENIDTRTNNGKLFFHIFGALAEYEREIIRERTKAGLSAARSRGRTAGASRR